MNTNIIGIDLGYSSAKIIFQNQMYKIPTAISFNNDVGITFGDELVYEFEGSKYIVGESASSSDEAFSTTNQKFLFKFAPLIIYHIFNKLGLLDSPNVFELRTGLALVDWSEKDEFIDRISNIEVNGKVLKTTPILVPQGAGVYLDYVNTNYGGDFTSSMSVIDIGYNTVNFLYFEDGVPVRSKLRSYPGHGAISILKPFVDYLENSFKLRFSQQEAIKIFFKESFTFQGIEQTQVTEKIQELKFQFIKKLFGSILEPEKKTLGTSEVVVLAGGGCYFMDNIEFEDRNIKFVEKPYEFSNVRGYII